MSRSEMRPAEKSLCAWREPLGQSGKVFIAQLADGSIDLLIVEVGGFQRSLRLVGRKKRSNGFFVGLARLGGPRGVFGQVAQRNDVLLVLGPSLGLPPHPTEGQSPAPTHTPSRENAFFLLFLAGVNSLRIGSWCDKKLLRDVAPIEESLCRQGLLVLRGVDQFPLALDDPGTNLGGALSLPDCSNV